MADLAEALDAALSARYPFAEPKTPITQKRGLTARMNALERQFAQKGDRKGAAARRAAEAAGISQRTWQRWKAGSQKPAATTLRKLQTAYNRLITLPKMRRSLKAKPVPNSVTVTATIKWGKSRHIYNATPHRTTTLGNMRSVMARVIRAWASAGPEAAAAAFEAGAAAVYSQPEIKFEGDNVEVEFPW